MSNEILELIKEGMKGDDLLSQIYGDVAKPGAKQVGKALETIVGVGNTILWPVVWLNERARVTLDKNLDRYRHPNSTSPNG